MTGLRAVALCERASTVIEDVNKLESSNIPLLEKEGSLRHQ